MVIDDGGRDMDMDMDTPLGIVSYCTVLLCVPLIVPVRAGSPNEKQGEYIHPPRINGFSFPFFHQSTVFYAALPPHVRDL